MSELDIELFKQKCFRSKLAYLHDLISWGPVNERYFALKVQETLLGFPGSFLAMLQQTNEKGLIYFDEAKLYEIASVPSMTFIMRHFVTNHLLENKNIFIQEVFINNVIDTIFGSWITYDDEGKLSEDKFRFHPTPLGRSEVFDSPEPNVHRLFYNLPLPPTVTVGNLKIRSCSLINRVFEYPNTRSKFVSLVRFLDGFKQIDDGTPYVFLKLEHLFENHFQLFCELFNKIETDKKDLANQCLGLCKSSNDNLFMMLLLLKRPDFSDFSQRDVSKMMQFVQMYHSYATKSFKFNLLLNAGIELLMINKKDVPDEIIDEYESRIQGLSKKQADVNRLIDLIETSNVVELAKFNPLLVPDGLDMDNVPLVHRVKDISTLQTLLSRFPRINLMQRDTRGFNLFMVLFKNEKLVNFLPFFQELNPSMYLGNTYDDSNVLFHVRTPDHLAQLRLLLGPDFYRLLDWVNLNGLTPLTANIENVDMIKAFLNEEASLHPFLYKTNHPIDLLIKGYSEENADSFFPIIIKLLQYPIVRREYNICNTITVLIEKIVDVSKSAKRVRIDSKAMLTELFLTIKECDWCRRYSTELSRSYTLIDILLQAKEIPDSIVIDFIRITGCGGEFVYSYMILSRLLSVKDDHSELLLLLCKTGLRYEMIVNTQNTKRLDVVLMELLGSEEKDQWSVFNRFLHDESIAEAQVRIKACFDKVGSEYPAFRQTMVDAENLIRQNKTMYGNPGMPRFIA